MSQNNKTYHFLAGLPRSGSTMLSAIMNQHPDVYFSPQTDLSQILFLLHQEIPQTESYRSGVLHTGYRNILSQATNSLYEHIEKPMVVDKNRAWGTPYNVENLIPFVNPDAKFILTLRPILEVLASFIALSKINIEKNGNDPYFDPSLYSSMYMNEDDARVDFLMRNNGEMEKSILSTYYLLKNYPDKVFIIWYDELVNNTKETVNRLSSFLEIESFNPNLRNIKSIDPQDDLSGYGLDGLHDVKSFIAKSKTKPLEILSDFTINKYKNAIEHIEALIK